VGGGGCIRVAGTTLAPLKAMAVITTPDGRYIVVRGRLWRASNPGLSAGEIQRLTDRLMETRRAVGAAKRQGDREAERAARAGVQKAKVALGERGPVWWTDGSPDLNRYLVKNTDYAEWFEAIEP